MPTPESRRPLPPEGHSRPTENPPPLPVPITEIRLAGAEADGAAVELEGPDQRYEVLELLGAGGMGEVFEARDRLFNRQVAVKFVKGSARRAEFIREAKTSGLLTHPNIPPVYDIGVDSTGRPYYVMQLIRGRSLAEVLRERSDGTGNWSQVRILAMFQQVCAALEYAHERGLIHLDVKPANVMIGQFQQLYLVDWGLSASDSEESSGIRGTPAYMSPEQARGEGRLSASSDVFSAGCVLYEICTGKRAFTAPGGEEILELVRRADFDRTDSWNDIPLELRELISSSLSLDPQSRPTAGEVSNGIQVFLDGTKEAERRRESAMAALESARSQLCRRDELSLRIAEIQDSVEQLRPDSWAPTSERSEFWTAEDDLERARIESEIALERATSLVLEAHRNAPNAPEVVTSIAEFYWDRFLEAEKGQKAFQAEFFRRQLLGLNVEGYRERLGAPGRLRISGRPELHRMELWALGEVDRVLRSTQRVPLENGAATIPPGRYQVEVETEGYRRIRLPVLVHRETHLELTIRLRSESEIGDDFVFVPGGQFIMGGDDSTLKSRPRQVREVPDFCIARFPTTWLEYQQFLQSTLEGGDEVTAHLPKIETDAGPTWRVENGRVTYTSDEDVKRARSRWPIVGVTYDDALAYCRWRSGRDGKLYDLPREEEWEKAARGVDGRLFPWGNRFDPSLCHNAGSTPNKAQPGPVGAYPTDCSPYGVRDMAGLVREWCSSWFDEGNRHRVVCGGAWNAGDVSTHCAYRVGCSPEQTYHFLGFRLVHRFS
ncbi:MAG: SUMF1/EgtB/PvdO family nonheme iron enzyme [Planctomycetes bacterium]|nr:SUMF1/EgtB/PvdO family nonheme iron enzyme [Planctomycetota bacterium]